MDIVAIFDKLSAPLRRRVRLMVSRAILAAVNDSGGIQVVQVKLLQGEVRDGVERMQNYGYTSVPLAGAEGVMVCVSGDRDHGIVIAMDDRRYRIKGLESGDVAVYDYRGQYIHLHDGGITAHTEQTFRVEADVIQLHAGSLFQFDCKGHGQKWYPDRIDTWQIGEVAGTPHNIAPPEIP